MNVEVKKFRTHLTRQEIDVRIAYGSDLALLVFPLFDPNRSDPTPEFAAEFVNGFNAIFFDKGDQALKFIDTLKEWQKNKIWKVFIIGGMGGAEYWTGKSSLIIPSVV